MQERREECLTRLHHEGVERAMAERLAQEAVLEFACDAGVVMWHQGVGILIDCTHGYGVVMSRTDIVERFETWRASPHILYCLAAKKLWDRWMYRTHVLEPQRRARQKQLDLPLD